MAHIRKQVRDAVAARITGLPTTGANVFKSRVDPLPDSSLPALRVYTIRDEAERLTQGTAPRVERQIQVVIEGVVKISTDLEDALDLIGVEVEVALAGQDLGGLVEDFFLVEATKALSGEGEQQAGLLRMEFSATAHVAENDPETALA